MLAEPYEAKNETVEYRFYDSRRQQSTTAYPRAPREQVPLCKKFKFAIFGLPQRRYFE